MSRVNYTIISKTGLMDKLIRGIDSLGQEILEKKIQDSPDDKKYEKSVARRCPSNIISLES
jgi:hypothetical protein